MKIVTETQVVPGLGAVTATILVQHESSLRLTIRRLQSAHLEDGILAPFRSIASIKEAFGLS